jgi:protein involved in polysaccharide export with SLBB domain
MKNKLVTILFLLCAVFLGAQLTSLVSSSSPVIPISVSVTGFVPDPGSYSLPLTARLSDAIRATKLNLPDVDDPLSLSFAEKKLLERDSLYTNQQGLRKIKLTRGDHTQEYDLMRFMILGEPEHNPLLRDGDLIWVPAKESFVSVSGCVNLPSDIQFVEGDDLGLILRLAQGLAPDADKTQVLIYRAKSGAKDFDVFRQDISAYADLEAVNYPLQPRDRIIVGRDANSPLARKVKVEGAVNIPGEFWIGENTRLYDILKQCGGPAEKGDLGNAVLINGPYSERLNPDIERLIIHGNAQMTPLEYSYLRNSLRMLKGKYSLDLKDTWESEGESSNPILQDGDYIFVPENFDFVAVSGQVVNPGLVPWVEGKGYKYYVDACGGYTNNRVLGGIRVVRDNDGGWVKPSKKLQLRPGDMVFVPEKSDRDRWTDLKDVALLATQILSIVMSVRVLVLNR